MEERPDHLVTFHVTLPLKTPTAARSSFTLLVADPEFFIDFEFDDNHRRSRSTRAPAGCSASLAKPKPLEEADKTKLDEFFFTNLVARIQFRLQDGEPRDHRLPMKTIRQTLACAFWALLLARRIGVRAPPSPVRGRRR